MTACNSLSWPIAVPGTLVSGHCILRGGFSTIEEVIRMTIANKKFRILLIDDSLAVRHVLTNVISSDPQLELAGTASNGRIGLDRIEQLQPDLVVMDIEMPEMDGLATLAEVRKKRKRLPVIMFSALTHRGAASTLEALSLGADDYVPKKSNSMGLAESIEELRRTLLPKIHALCSRDLPEPPMPAAAAAKAAPVPPRQAERKIELVVLGISTGGPEILWKVLPDIPADLPVPMVMVQHMPPIFTRLLADRLSSKCQMPVKEAEGGEQLLPGTVWLAPGGKHLQITSTGEALYLRLDETTPPRNFCRPSVDVLFESAVKVAGPGTLGAVLTGMGRDGLQGCELIRKAGGQIVVQDQATSVVWGMPGAVARAGLADSIKPMAEIMPEIVKRVMKFRTGVVPGANLGSTRGAYVQQSK
jgi:two-component system chemotaxis response regulator CheB